MSAAPRLCWLSVLLVVGLAASGWIAWTRHRLDSAYRVVEVALDSEDWRILAVREGQDDPVFWQQLRRLGAGSIAVYDSTLRRLADAGLVAYVDGATLISQARAGTVGSALRSLAADADPGTVYVLPANEEVASLVRDGFATAIGADRIERVRDQPPVYRVRGRLKDLEETGLGFLPSAVAAWERQGFRVILRPRNVRSMTAQRLPQRISGYAAFGRGRTFVFDLAEVLGFERLVDEAAAALREIDAVYGRVEILTTARRMRGEETMAQLMRPNVVRVFSIVPEELERLEMRVAVDRYVRGARERNLRVLYVRPFLSTPGGVDAVEHNLTYLRAIVSGVRDAGFALGTARPLPAPGMPRGLLYGAVLAAVVAVVWMLLLFAERVELGVPSWTAGVLIAVGVLGAVGLSAAGYGAWMRKLYALAAAIAFPTLAVFYGIRQLWSEGGHARASSAVGDAALALWAVSAGSVLGGIVVAALLTEWSFMLAFDVFWGVKVATVVPIGLLAALWLLDTRRGVRDAVARVRDLASRPVTLGAVVAVMAVGATALLLLLRTGNTGLPVLGVEERLREALERALVARPRTKEYLLGHPMFIAGAAAAAVGLRRWAVPLILVGMIGQVGLINSFAHAHTPILYTVWRTFNGLVLGTALGAVFVVVAQFVLRRWAGWVPQTAAARDGPPYGGEPAQTAPTSDSQRPGSVALSGRRLPTAAPPRSPGAD
ncbi:MAG: DUF5693 family protein [Armatimonadota bacterium]|nr:DUF5693 family protein [Armatimonadota bacterium]MDR5697292.1 DUF5693 family protein [Armatimonadota bacterium]